MRSIYCDMLSLPHLFAILCVALLGTGSAIAKPNVLFIIADDLRTELGCYGSKVASSPNIDALAARGLRFDHAYCQGAVCWPSRNSFFSGLMPANLGKANSEITFRESHPDIASMPQWFKQHGWHTRGFGKVLHDGQDDPVSWSEPLFTPPPNQYGLTENQGKHPIINRSDPANRANPLFESADVSDESYEDGLTSDAAANAIREAPEGKPFFYMVGFHKPHTPFNAPKKYWDLYSREEIPLSPVPNPPAKAPLDFAVHNWNYVRSFSAIPADGPMPDELAREARHAYFACVSYVDTLTGKLLSAIDETGRTDDTIVIFTSDHGYHLGDQSMWSKHTTFEIATRVPLIFAGPPVPNGGSTKALVELVDLYPTLCDTAGLDKPDHLEGISFAPVLADPTTTARNSAYSEFNRKGAKGRSIRTGRFRYTEWRSLKTNELLARELYDHVSDPLESVNLANDPGRFETMDGLSEILTGRQP